MVGTARRAVHWEAELPPDTRAQASPEATPRQAARPHLKLFFLFPFSIRLHSDGVKLSAKEIRNAVQAALAEDIGSGDATTLAIVPETATAKAVMRAREPLVVAGLDFAQAAFRELSTAVKIERLAKDGQRTGNDEILLKISGSARAI